MPRSSSRIVKKLSGSLEKRLNLYSLAASAVGLGSLALAHPAEAKIVYTPANIPIPQNGGLINFDLNHDGVYDFGLSDVYFRSEFQGGGSLKVVQAQSANEVWGIKSKGLLCAAALQKNVVVGSKGNFQKDPLAGLVMAFTNLEGTYYGSWQKVNQAYLGLKFVVKGKVHFGWARVNIKARGISIKARLTGYAYETVPNKSILTGKTKGPDVIKMPVQAPQATLGRLALGRK